MSEIRTKSTLLGASFPGRRIASLERFVASPPSNVPAEDDGGGLLFGLFGLFILRLVGEKAVCSSARRRLMLNDPAPLLQNMLHFWFSKARELGGGGICLPF